MTTRIDLDADFFKRLPIHVAAALETSCMREHPIVAAVPQVF